MPDEGKVEWSKNVRVGYLDQHTALQKGMTIRDVLASAFDFLYEMEARMNEICDKMGEASEEELEAYMEELGTIQDLLTQHDFYMIDSKVEEVARALGILEVGLDTDVTDLSVIMSSVSNSTTSISGVSYTSFIFFTPLSSIRISHLL